MLIWELNCATAAKPDEHWLVARFYLTPLRWLPLSRSGFRLQRDPDPDASAFRKSAGAHNGAFARFWTYAHPPPFAV
ncbi:hypothetical protein MAE02_54850 [Microvirga aerophila]|uniref:Uncharacterized protein n=1 Tax=Microvirga aerophila TaxID=670291 RepID=A0A512C0Q7_9HYPH|nr:hypothetical protein MAE02_54850 [Microvirga aerophila]